MDIHVLQFIIINTEKEKEKRIQKRGYIVLNAARTARENKQVRYADHVAWPYLLLEWETRIYSVIVHQPIPDIDTK